MIRAASMSDVSGRHVTTPFIITSSTVASPKGRPP